MTFEKHIRSVPIVVCQRLGIVTKYWRVFHDQSAMVRCFWGFVMPILEYCSVLRCSAADTHHRLLDCVVTRASFLAGSVLECNLSSRRSVAVLCMGSAVTLCIDFVVHCLCLLYQYVLHFDTVLWFLIVICMHLFAAEPRSFAGL